MPPINPNEVNDLDLWTRLRKGDDKALIALYELFHGDLFNYGLRICGEEQIVRDGIQDVFLRLWEKKKALKAIKKVKPYLLRILRNILIDRIKKEKIFISDESDFSAKLFEESIEASIIKIEIEHTFHQKLSQSFNKLTHRQREILFLRFYQNLSYQEIADVTQIRYQSVRNLSSEGLKRLRKVFPK